MYQDLFFLLAFIGRILIAVSGEVPEWRTVSFSPNSDTINPTMLVVFISLQHMTSLFILSLSVTNVSKCLFYLRSLLRMPAWSPPCHSLQPPGGWPGPQPGCCSPLWRSWWTVPPLSHHHQLVWGAALLLVPMLPPGHNDLPHMLVPHGKSTVPLLHHQVAATVHAGEPGLSHQLCSTLSNMGDNFWWSSITFFQIPLLVWISQ